MRINPTHLTPLLVAGAAVAIVAAPIAMAAPTPLKDCIVTGAATTCQSPGNIEITNLPPIVNFYPYGTMPFLLGGH
jgi:hypothetical protein